MSNSPLYPPEQPISPLSNENLLNLLKQYDLDFRISIGPDRTADLKTQAFAQGKLMQIKRLLELLQQGNVLVSIEATASNDLNNNTLASKSPDTDQTLYKTNSQISPEEFPQLSQEQVANLLLEYASKQQSLLSAQQNKAEEMVGFRLGELSVLKQILQNLNQANILTQIEQTVIRHDMSLHNTPQPKEPTQRPTDSDPTIIANHLIQTMDGLIQIAQAGSLDVSKEKLVVELSSLERILDMTRDLLVGEPEKRSQINQQLDRLRNLIWDLAEQSDREALLASLQSAAEQLKSRFIPEQENDTSTIHKTTPEEKARTKFLQDYNQAKQEGRPFMFCGVVDDPGVSAIHGTQMVRITELESGEFQLGYGMVTRTDFRQNPEMVNEQTFINYMKKLGVEDRLVNEVIASTKPGYELDLEDM